MNCANHPESPATAYCRACGKPLCPVCQRSAEGTVFCAEHAPVAAAPPGMPPPPPAAPEWSPYTAPAVPPSLLLRTDVSPGLAFILGLIPGVGAIYNSQYVKAFLHVIVVGILISILGSDVSHGFEPLFGLLLAAFWIYMAFEAYHTARKRQLGEPVDEFSSIVPMRRRGFPVGPTLLIAFGLLFLMINFDIVTFDRIIRYWPVALIMLGVWLLYERFAAARENQNAAYTAQQVQHDR